MGWLLLQSNHWYVAPDWLAVNTVACTFIVESIVFTVKFKVAVLSQPNALVKPVAVCEPVLVNVRPFQLYGRSAEQMLKLVVEELAAFTVRFNVAVLSQPREVVKPVLVCEPALVNVRPFQL